MEGTGHRLSRTLPALYPPSMTIRQLSPETINRIAAGEVIERPASAVKELVENALDAGAQRDRGGHRGRRALAHPRHRRRRTAWAPADLALAVERHATSKLADEDLFNIATLGFRGEALPSIGSVAHLRDRSRASGKAARRTRSWSIAARRARRGRPRVNTGTCVEVRELFSATPARLKFLKSERAENMAISEVVKRLAMAHPHVGFSLTTGERAGPAGCRARSLRPDGLLSGSGASWAASSSTTRCPSTGARGRAADGLRRAADSAPADAGQQYLFVNGRPVKDKLLVGAVRAAYGDLLPKGRYPLLALFVDARRRTRSTSTCIRQGRGEVPRRRNRAGAVVGGVRHALEGAGHRASMRGGAATLEAFHAATIPGDAAQAQAMPPHLQTATAAPSYTQSTFGYRPTRPASCRPAWRKRCRRRSRLSTSRARMRAPPRRRCRMRSCRPSARCGPRAGARDLHHRADPSFDGDRRPARRARAPRLRAHEGGAGRRRRDAPGAADSGDRRARR